MLRTASIGLAVAVMAWGILSPTANAVTFSGITSSQDPNPLGAVLAGSYDGTTPTGAMWVGGSPLVSPPPANESAVYQSPFNNTAAGDDVAPDNTYFSVGGVDSDGEGSTSPKTLMYDSDKVSFSFFWGSIDSYNTIEFYDGATLIDSFTGTEIIYGDGGSNAGLGFVGNGNAGGSNYEQVALIEFVMEGTEVFNKVVFSSTLAAFEFAFNSSGDNTTEVPLPAPIILLLSGLLGLGFLGRFKSKAA